MRNLELTKEDLELLISKQTSPCLSLYMPTHTAGPETRQDPLRLKTILQEAEHRLIESGIYGKKAKDFLIKPALELINNEHFWRHQSEGLALFISQDIFEYYRLPIAFEELVVVSDRFHIKPLFPVFSGDGYFYILNLNRKNPKIFKASRYSIQELELEGMPEGLDEALGFDTVGKPTLSHLIAPSHGSNGSTGIGHGQIFGTDAAAEIKDLTNYFHIINKVIEKGIRHVSAPMVLTGVEYYFPLYRQVNTFPNLLDEEIRGSVDHLSEEELHTKAWKLVQPVFGQALTKAVSQYDINTSTRNNGSSKMTSSELKEVILASYYGQIDTLFIADREQQWGRFDAESNIIHLHNEEKIGDQDLYDLIAIQTFLNGGRVFVIPRDQIPGSQAIAAIFRYPENVNALELPKVVTSGV